VSLVEKVQEGGGGFSRYPVHSLARIVKMLCTQRRVSQALGEEEESRNFSVGELA